VRVRCKAGQVSTTHSSRTGSLPLRPITYHYCICPFIFRSSPARQGHNVAPTSNVAQSRTLIVSTAPRTLSSIVHSYSRRLEHHGQLQLLFVRKTGFPRNAFFGALVRSDANQTRVRDETSLFVSSRWQPYVRARAPEQSCGRVSEIARSPVRSVGSKWWAPGPTATETATGSARLARTGSSAAAKPIRPWSLPVGSRDAFSVRAGPVAVWFVFALASFVCFLCAFQRKFFVFFPRKFLCGLVFFFDVGHRIIIHPHTYRG